MSENKNIIFSMIGVSKSFENNNKHISRSSLICNVKVEDYEKRIVLPHEKTRERQKKIDLS